MAFENVFFWAVGFFSEVCGELDVELLGLAAHNVEALQCVEMSVLVD